MRHAHIARNRETMPVDHSGKLTLLPDRVRARMPIAMREIGVERSFVERDSQSGFTKKSVIYVRIMSAGATAALRHGGQGGSACSRVGTSAGSIWSGMIGSSLRAEPAR